MKEQFSVGDVAFIFDVTHATVYNWMKKGKLPDDDITAESIEQVIEDEQARIDKARKRFRVVSRGAVVEATP